MKPNGHQKELGAVYHLFTIDNSLLRISLIGTVVVVLTTISIVVERVVSSAHIITQKVYVECILVLIFFKVF